MDLVAANSGKSRHDLAAFLKNYLVRTYPTQYWVVTVYDPVKGFQNHAFNGYTDRIGWKLRHAGVNYVVTRYPRHSARSPSVPISELVGSVTGSHPETVLNSLKDKFRARGISWASIHVVKRKRSEGWWLGKRNVGITLTTSIYIPVNNYFWREFSHVIVIAVAPY